MREKDSGLGMTRIRHQAHQLSALFHRSVIKISISQLVMSH